MYTGNHYSLKEFLFWTRRDIYKLLIIGILPTLIYQLLGWHWVAIPWLPIAMVGTAAAFIVGFRNTQTYNRLWEARQIYGAIVNLSRTWGMMVKDFVSQPEAHQELIYRHIGWLTALRFQLRESRTWENIYKPHNVEYRKYYQIAEHNENLPDVLKKYISEHDETYVLSKKNKATHLIALQSKQLKSLKEQGHIDPLCYIELEQLLANLYDQQGKCERIKNFPYPRQFASINLFFIQLFNILVPFGLLNEFQKMGEHMVWLTIPFSIMVSWVFMSMERVGESTENPFEGGANDVPITSLTRTIEIDLREMLDEKDIPAPIAAQHEILL